MSEQTNKIPAAAYCRVSTAGDLQDGSFEVQCDYYRKLIDADNELELVGIYGDYGKSGKTMRKRPELQRLIKDCATGKIKLIYTKSISRFARNMMECVETIRYLRELGVKVIFEKEGLDTESMGGELMLGILATIAQEESNSISQNVRWSRHEHALKGEPWEKPSYGFVSVGEHHQWEIVPEQVDVIRQAFYMAGMSYRYSEILQEMNRMEQEMGSDRMWSHRTMVRILKDRVYVGEYISNKTVLTVARDGQTRQVPNRGFVDQVRIEDHHKAVVSQELFDAVGRLISLGVLSDWRKHFTADEEREMQAAMAIATKEAKQWESELP